MLLAVVLANCAQPLLKSDVSVKQHMLAVTIPASTVVFAVAGQAPKEAAEWQAVKANALALVDSGAWLLAHPPAVASQHWLQTAKNMVDAAQAAATATETKDAESVANAGNTLYETCANCHAEYLNKPALTP
jgi:hypothetical protein